MLFILLVGFIIFIFGASIGSFIAASVYRLNKKMSIVSGRSQCPKCGYKLDFFDLFPIFSFIYLRGKCKKCKKGIEIGDFLIEIITGILFLVIFFYRWIYAYDTDIFSLFVIRDWIFMSGLVFLFIYDLKYSILPDIVTIPLILLMLIFNLLLGFNVFNLLIAIAIGGGFFLLQFLISRGKWVGDGDIRMGAVLGAGLGYPGILFALFVAYMIGAIFAGVLLLFKKAKMKSEIAFGTFLAIGGVMTLFFGDKIISWYLGLIL